MERAVIITGANGGIGSALADALVAAGRPLIAVCRRREPGEALLARLPARAPAALVVADLSSSEGVAAAVAGIRARAESVSVLVHNAGIWPTRLQQTDAGFEASYAVNHLAPFALTAALWPLLRASAPSRVLLVTAGLAALGRTDLAAVADGTRFSALRTYADTKLCGALFARELADRASGSGVDIQAIHPGVIRTGLGDGPGLGPWLVGLVKRLWASPEAAAQALLPLCRDGALPQPSGTYWSARQPAAWPGPVEDGGLRERLWEETEAQLGRRFRPA